MKYQIQQLIYELIVFWHGQYNGDWNTVWDMVHNSLKVRFYTDDFYADGDTNESIERYNRFLLTNNYLMVWTTVVKMIDPVLYEKAVCDNFLNGGK